MTYFFKECFMQIISKLTLWTMVSHYCVCTEFAKCSLLIGLLLF